jgi:hypothetical protein
MLDSIESGFYKVMLPRPRAKIRRAACADLRNASQKLRSL